MLGHASEMKKLRAAARRQSPAFRLRGRQHPRSRSELGRGTKLSNTPITHGRRITITIDDVTYDTGLDKLGAIGDGGQTGCNAVLNPGVVLGPRVLVYPNVSVRGYHAADSILEMRQDIEPTTRR
jgi:hypothetical protein